MPSRGATPHDQDEHSPPGRSARVVAAHAASYADPIRLRAGDLVVLGPRDERWPEYIWAQGPDGREGWVHETCLDVNPAGAGALANPGVARATREYDATELTVRPGDRLRVLHEAGGWLFCQLDGGGRGWLPGECIVLD